VRFRHEESLGFFLRLSIRRNVCKYTTSRLLSLLMISIFGNILLLGLRFSTMNTPTPSATADGPTKSNRCCLCLFLIPVSEEIMCLHDRHLDKLRSGCCRSYGLDWCRSNQLGANRVSLEITAPNTTSTGRNSNIKINYIAGFILDGPPSITISSAHPIVLHSIVGRKEIKSIMFTKLDAVDSRVINMITKFI
jgi:hypothetical protein